MPKQLLTQQFVDSPLSCEPGKSKVDFFDSKVTGLLLKVLASGKKTYYLRYSNLRGKVVEQKLASAENLKLADARKLAQEKLAQLAMGEDPFEKKAALKTVPTFAEFVADSYLPHVKTYKRSWSTDECLLRNHVLPALGSLYLDEITRRHMIHLFNQHRVKHKPGSTNRVIILCRYIFNCAKKWETPGVSPNPTHGIALYPAHNMRARYISQEEAQRLFEALEASDSKMLKYIVAMLLLTGARKREVLDARWSDFDLENRLWRIEFNKTGKPRHVPLSDGALQLLASLPRREGCDYAFANPDTGKPFVSFFYSWDTARKRAGMADVRIHDLRHSFASFLINGGRSLYEVQKILGHTQVKTTQRYAHLSHDSLVAAANTAAVSVPLLQRMPMRANEVPLLAAQ